MKEEIFIDDKITKITKQKAKGILILMKNVKSGAIIFQMKKGKNHFLKLLTTKQ